MNKHELNCKPMKTTVTKKEKKRKEKKPTYITKSRLKSEYHLPESIIAMLPEPIKKPNPHYRQAGAPMLLWDVDVVKRKLKTKKFQEAIQKASVRQNSAKKAVATKRAKTTLEFDSAIKNIVVEVIPQEELRQVALDHAQIRNDVRSMLYGHENSDCYSAPEETKQRWDVNYIRHNLTEYDDTLYEAQGKVGCNDEYRRYRNAVLDAIAVAYPYLSEAVARQKYYC